MKALGSCLMLSALLTSCAWVTPTTRGQAIAYLQPAQVQSCQKLGRVSVETVNKVALMQRDAVKVQNELITMAKNEAVVLKADTIAPESEVTDGRQTFLAYKCR
ncbi:MAG TPA: DUF4156 domain-containing protein [Cellvibrionaceae bacterium]|nr:DUF4156 domain-containing protein [Cellvibrionaceae bacterium]